MAKSLSAGLLLGTQPVVERIVFGLLNYQFVVKYLQ